MLISTCQQRKFEMYIELIMVCVLHIVTAFIHYFQQIRSMSKSSQNLLLLIERRRAGFFVRKLAFVRKIVHGRLASHKCSDNAKKLLCIFEKFVEEIYSDNNYPKVREIFETKVEDYLYQETEFIETLIEDIAEEFFFKREKNIIGLLDIPNNIFEINRALIENRGGKMTILDDCDDIC